jgi:hypothetical protein
MFEEGRAWGAPFIQHRCCMLPQRGATDGGASERPGPPVDRLAALESPALLHDTVVLPSIAIFMRGGERNS